MGGATVVQSEFALCPTWASTLTEYEPTLTQHVPSEAVLRAERIPLAMRDVLTLGDGAFHGQSYAETRRLAARLLFARWHWNRRLDLRRRVCPSGGEASGG